MENPFETDGPDAVPAPAEQGPCASNPRPEGASGEVTGPGLGAEPGAAGQGAPEGLVRSKQEDELLARLQALESEFMNRLSQLENGLAQLAADERERAEQRHNREALYRLLDASKLSFQFQLLRPIVQRLALLFDLIHSFRQRPPQDPDAIARAFQMLFDHLSETLQAQGIEMVVAAPNEKFDVRFHHVVETVATAVPELHECVAALVLHGFAYYGQNDRTGDVRPCVIRPARVILWRHDPNVKENKEHQVSNVQPPDNLAAGTD